MDANLKRLADASLEVSAAEEALEDSAFHTARDRLDAADAVLGELRAAWTDMSAAERGVIGPAARGVRERLDAAGARVPRLTALVDGTPVVDAEQDRPPD